MDNKKLHNHLQVKDGDIPIDVEGRLFSFSIKSARNLFIALFGVLSRHAPDTLGDLYCIYCGEVMSNHLITERGGACEPSDV